MRTVVLVGLLWGSVATAARADDEPRYFFGSSAFMLVNLAPGDYPPDFVQLNAGMRFGHADALSIEAITWRYDHPLGVPWGPDKMATTNEYPGYVREVGIGLAYQHLWWEGAYTSISAVPFLRQFRDDAGRDLGSGFQLFLTARAGWHLDFLDRLFVEPSVAFTAWPISTGAPASFAAKDEAWPSYFLFEPGLHFGVEL